MNADAQALYQNWASDPEVVKYLTWPVHSSVDVSKAVIEDWISSYQKKDYYQWAIVLKEHGADPIGSISAVSMNDAIDMVHIGYCLGQKWWHRKYEGTMRMADRNNQGICDACWYALLKSERSLADQ